MIDAIHARSTNPLDLRQTSIETPYIIYNHAAIACLRMNVVLSFTSSCACAACVIRGGAESAITLVICTTTVLAARLKKKRDLTARPCRETKVAVYHRLLHAFATLQASENINPGNVTVA